MRTICIMFLFALLLQGCGKKGPLYLPTPQREQASAPAATIQPAAPQAGQPPSTASK